jgi:hypothetical protein
MCRSRRNAISSARRSSGSVPGRAAPGRAAPETATAISATLASSAAATAASPEAVTASTAVSAGSASDSLDFNWFTLCRVGLVGGSPPVDRQKISPPGDGMRPPDGCGAFSVGKLHRFSLDSRSIGRSHREPGVPAR